RGGRSNIGGTAQSTVGAVFPLQFGVWFAGLPQPLHLFLALGVAMLAGAAWAGIAGILRATVGAHEVITTIMLNYIAYYVASWLIGVGGPLQQNRPGQESVPESNTIAASAHLPVFWGNALLQGLHIGIFIAIGALV